MKKKYLVYGFLPVLALALVAGTTYAATKTVKNNPFSAIAAAIATKFNLNTADVQSVIDTTTATQRAQMQKNRPVRMAPLAQAVSNGKLTQAQADLITAKIKELKTATDNLKGKTPAERMAIMKTQTASLKQWATDNKIPAQYLMPLGNRGQGRMHKPSVSVK